MKRLVTWLSVISIIALWPAPGLPSDEQAPREVWHYLNFEEKPAKGGQQVEGKFGKGLFFKEGCITLENRDFNESQFSVLMWIKPQWEKAPPINNPPWYFGAWWGGRMGLTCGENINVILYNFVVLDPGRPVRRRAETVISAAIGKPPSGWWQDGKWHHLTVTINCWEGRITAYFDGKVAGEYKTKPFERVEAVGKFFLGSIHAGPVNIACDDVAVCGWELKPEEVEAIVKSDKPFGAKEAGK